MREFTFHASLARSASRSAELAIIPYIASLEPGSRASRVRDLAAMIYDDQLAPAVSIFTSNASEAASARPRVDPNNDIVLDLPPTMIDAPWKVAILLNLLDYGTAPIEGEESLRFITSAELSLPAAAGVALNALQPALQAWKSDCLDWMRQEIWPSADTEDSPLEQWPDDFENAGVEILMEYDAPLETDADARALKQLGRDLEALGAWTGLETRQLDIDAWNEQMLEYPVTRDSTRVSMRYHVEFSPANPAPLLRLFSDLLERRYERRIEKWAIRAYPL